MIPYESGHISDELLMELNRNALDETTTLKVYEHIASCGYCAERYASSLESDLIKAPTQLHDAILDQAIRIPTALQAARVKFYRYCFRVGLAVCASVFLVMSAGNLQPRTLIMPRIPTQTESNAFQFMDQLNNHLRNFSEQLVPNFNKEDPHHD